MDAHASLQRKSIADILHNEVMAWLFLAISLLLTWFGWYVATYYVEERASERFIFAIEDAKQRIQERMRNYEQVLRGGVAFLNTIDRLATRAEWRSYVSSLQLATYFPGIQGVGLTLMIKPSDLPAHIAAIRASGFPNYQVRPSGLRDQYSSIIYLEPFDWRNQRAFGYDMFSEPVRHKAMVLARDTGETAISGRVTLVQETTEDVQAGFLMYMPFYIKTNNEGGETLKQYPEHANAHIHDVVMQRRETLIGYVYSPFRMRDLMSGILGWDRSDLGFEIYDGVNTQNAQNLLYKTSDNGFNEAMRTQTNIIELNGHSWTTRFYSLPSFEASLTSNQPELIAIGGLVIDVLLFIIILTLANERRLVQAKAEAMTIDLQHIIDTQKRTEERLLLSASVFQHAHEAIIITDANQRVLEINPSFTELTGYSREEVIGNLPPTLRPNNYDQAFYTNVWDSITKRGFWRGEVWSHRKNGEAYAELATVSSITSPDGNITHYVGMFSDITTLKQQQRQLEQLAHYDPLTNLPNRVFLAHRMELDIASARKSGKPLAVCYLDLDGFKHVNDSYGHDVGDQLLIQVSDRLSRLLRPGDTVARMGGDEFVLLLGDLQSMQECELIVLRTLQAINTKYLIGHNPIDISASIGITMFPADDVDADSLLRHADQVMYQAKENGRNRYYVFDTEHDRQARNFRDMLAKIEDALVANEFVLYYQPKVDMRNGKVLGAEALIRWNHPSQKLMLPHEFLPKTEETEFAIHLGNWVINEALQQLSTWNASGFRTAVSVNISGQHLQHGNFVQSLQNLLKRYPEVSPKQLELEVLETTALDDINTASQIINTCRSFGVSVAIDDFGTGYSSLIYLKRLPADILKVDQSFVCDMLGDDASLAIIEGIIGLSQAVHRKVIAEGVESEEHGTTLLGLGCDLGQGYAIARPMPANDFPNWANSYIQPEAWSKAVHIDTSTPKHTNAYVGNTPTPPISNLTMGVVATRKVACA